MPLGPIDYKSVGAILARLKRMKHDDRPFPHARTR